MVGFNSVQNSAVENGWSVTKILWHHLLHLKLTGTKSTESLQSKVSNRFLFSTRGFPTLFLHRNHFSDIDRCYRHYNRDNKPYGTHLRLVVVASLLTSGDILELGAGLFSTPLLHNITQQWSSGQTRTLGTCQCLHRSDWDCCEPSHIKPTFRILFDIDSSPQWRRRRIKAGLVSLSSSGQAPIGWSSYPSVLNVKINHINISHLRRNWFTKLLPSLP